MDNLDKLALEHKKKRIKIWEVSPHTLIKHYLYLQKQPTTIQMSGLPEDAEVVGWHVNAYSDTLCVYVYSETFDEVLDHNIIPSLDALIIHVHNPVEVKL